LTRLLSCHLHHRRSRPHGWIGRMACLWCDGRPSTPSGSSDAKGRAILATPS
jgi:hypothetical protein